MGDLARLFSLFRLWRRCRGSRWVIQRNAVPWAEFPIRFDAFFTYRTVPRRTHAREGQSPLILRLRISLRVRELYCETTVVQGIGNELSLGRPGRKKKKLNVLASRT